MAEVDEEEDVQSLKLKHSLLIGLKTTVEGLLATHSNNVWSTYGGLSRICKDLERILNHRLKFVRDETGSVADFWTFAKGLKWLNPVLSPFIERIRKAGHQGESKGQVWVRESLLNHNLTAQLKILVNNKQHLHSFYFEDAFLFSEDYFEAMCVCLQAVEENKASLLAEINPKLLNFSKVLSSSFTLQRATSLPVAAKSCPPRPHRNSHGDTMALAPPFASPSKESVLTMSGEHTPICNIASSPDDSRTSAKEALRDVLRKSGSESPDPGNYSLYDPMNSDPLCNVDFLSDVKMRKEPSPVDNKPKTRKSTITRTVSESGIDEKQSKRRAVVLDKVIVEDDVFSAKPENVNKLTDSTKEPSIVIFSDSENVDVNSATSPKKSAKGKGPAHTHKRSRSDISGIKKTLTPAIAEGQISDGTPPNTDSTTSFHLDDVDGRRDSFFPQPVQGQSLLHYLSSQDFHTCATLDKENAHFSISEALIAAIEQMKWNHLISPKNKPSWEPEELDSDEEIKELRQRIRIRKRERLKEKARGFPAYSDGRTDTTPSTSHSQSASPYSSPHHSEYSDSAESSEVDDQEIDIAVDGEVSRSLSKSSLKASKSSGLSQSQASLASLFTDADVEKNVQYDKQNSLHSSSSTYFSAESVAISLLKKFSEKQLPKASDLQWLVTEQDAPQRLLPLPNSYPISPDDAENMQTSKNRTRLRGNMEWAPPRAQIIFNVHPPPRRNSLLGKQNYRCTGCGMKVEIGYAKRYRYCEYLGKYFCQCCHSNKLAYIPGRILQKWDFTKYYVSNFAFDLLTKMYTDPLFNLADINPMLYKKVRMLDHIKDWRQQLWHLKSLLQVCKHANKLLSEILKQPAHWVDDVHTYSISDLVSVKSGASGLMYNIMGKLVTESIAHVEKCQFCQCFGFICEMCREQKDIIFPYQLQKVTVCQGCKTCFHKKCFVPHKCPKCARIEARKQRLKEESLEDDDNDDSNDDDT